MGWELIVNGEAVGRWSALTGVWAVPGVWVCFGLHLALWMRSAAMQRRLVISGCMYSSTAVAVTL